MNQPKKLSFSLRSILAQEPELWLLYQPYIWVIQMKFKKAGVDPKESLVNSYTQLVIDGFMGSANSFATRAFKSSQMQSVILAHHLHSPTQIVKATKWRIPVLLTIREPMGTILSLTSRWPYISVTQGLKSYIGFYTTLKPYVSNYIVSTFEYTTQHLDLVIQVMNAKFDTHFDLVNIDRANAEFRQGECDPQARDKRNRLKQEKKEEFEIKKNKKLLRQANDIYKQFEVISQQTLKL